MEHNKLPLPDSNSISTDNPDSITANTINYTQINCFNNNVVNRKQLNDNNGTFNGDIHEFNLFNQFDVNNAKYRCFQWY